MTARSLHLGISPCPNDTFAFHGILERKVDLRGLDFEIDLLDVQELNQRLFAGEFDVAKASFHAALLLTDELGVLPVGAALGFGEGPLLLGAVGCRHPREPVRRAGEPGPRPARVLCPGAHTTATLLYRLFHPGEGVIDQVVFSDVMPALETGAADFGVCIHEGRFTWQDHGLVLVEDLGEVWEHETRSPLPLGGILARHRLGPDLVTTVSEVLRESLDYGHRHRDEALRSMRRYAQELSDDVLFAHVDLYVNAWTRDLGREGRGALDRLARRAVEAGVTSGGARPLTVFGPSSSGDAQRMPAPTRTPT